MLRDSIVTDRSQELEEVQKPNVTAVNRSVMKNDEGCIE